MAKRKNSKPPKLTEEPFKHEDQDFHEFMEAVNSLDETEINKKIQNSREENRKKVAKKSIRVERVKIDLHGLTVDEGKRRCRVEVEAAFKNNASNQIEFEVVTGRGLHSKDGRPVLAREIYEFCQNVFGLQTVQIDADPMQNTIDGIPIRGSFKMILKR